jgi:serine phosphatase RsbU (regulator of sigma subunit)/anti-sigma regulatory factor (Ser/Thr protein kinase)
MSAQTENGPDQAVSNAPRRWALIAALAAVLALAGIASALAWHQYSDARQRALGDLRAKVELTSGLLGEYFNGELGTLSSIAKAPVVVDRHQSGMLTYFHHVQPSGGKLFPGGLGWIDRSGISRVTSSEKAARAGTDVSDRTYFQTVMRTGRPYVSGGLRARPDPRKRIVIMAVPTRDRQGHLTGVLAGALLLNPTHATSPQTTDELGLQGVAIFDRGGQSLFAGFSHPPNAALLARLRHAKPGVVADTTGLDGRPGHVVAYANVPVAGMTVAIDLSRSTVFAAARHSLVLDLTLVGVVAALVIGVLLLLYVRARRAGDRRRVSELLRSDLARTLGATTTTSEVCEAVASAVGAAFPAALGVIALSDAGAGHVAVAASAGGDLAARAAEHGDELAEAASLADPSVRIVAIETRAELRQRLGSLDAALRGGAGSVYLLPLVTGAGRRSGVLLLLFGTEHGLNRDEQSLIASHAEQAARTLERARVHEREHAVAVTLQRSLLSETLPAVDSLELAARYEAGSLGLEVGGDWYDVVVRPDGIVLATVGDVAGRGITAATLMGRLRSAFRAYAYDHASPADVLRRLARHLESDEMATAVVLAVDPYSRDVAYASAGHLPPVLVDVATCEAQLLDQGGGPPLGALPAAEADFAEVTLCLPPCAALIAYTDGLIERRGESIDRGIELVTALMERSATLEADAAAGLILSEAAQREGGEDDVALLVLRSLYIPQRMELEIPADPSAVRLVRGRMRAWLGVLGLDEEQRADAVLAVSEACNNAIEHGYRDAGGAIGLSLALEGERLQMTVEDRGLWRLDATRNLERGRGLPIMRGVMDSVEIDRARTGTRVHLEQQVAHPGHPLAPVQESAPGDSAMSS